MPEPAMTIDPVTVWRGKPVDHLTRDELVAALSEMCWRWEEAQKAVEQELNTGYYRRGTA